VKVHALDALLSRLEASQAKLERARVEVMLRTSSTDSGSGSSGGETLERVFKDAIRGALVLSSTYVAELQKERDNAIAAACTRYDAVAGALNAAAAAAGGAGAGPAADDPRLAAAAAHKAAAIEAAEEGYVRAYSALVEEAKAYLATAAAPVTLLPTTVAVSVPSLGVRVDVRLRPTDSIASAVVPAVAAAVLESRRMDTVCYGPDAAWSVEGGPLAAATAAGAGAGAGAAGIAGVTVSSGGGSGTEAASTGAGAAPPGDDASAGAGAAAPTAAGGGLDVNAPLYRQCAGGRPAPGAVLVCRGAVTASSARASKCLAEHWLPGTRDDYFRCEDCRLQWICSSCAEACHRGSGHRVVPFLRGHVPTFACCYCRSRNAAKCALLHK
jgi:hypothetical protein